MAEFQFKFKRGKKRDLEIVNPFLLAGEPCFELDTYRLKIGDGTETSFYNNLPYTNNLEHIQEEEVKKIVQDLLLEENYGCYWDSIVIDV